MAELYFVDDRENSNTIFVKKDVGELVTGEEHDFGLLCEVGSQWVFEPIAAFRWLNATDIMDIAAKLIKLNDDERFVGELMPVGFVFTEFDYETASNAGSHIYFGNGCLAALSYDAACEIDQKFYNFFY